MPNPILLTDAVCNLCNRSVRFILKHERAPTLRFASLQSAAAASLLQDCDIAELSTLVLIDDAGVHTRSSAALRTLAHLRAPWRWLRVLAIIPRPIRDWLYIRVANTRYRIFGKSDSCPIPDPAHQSRFLDADERKEANA